MSDTLAFIGPANQLYFTARTLLTPTNEARQAVVVEHVIQRVLPARELKKDPIGDCSCLGPYPVGYRPGRLQLKGLRPKRAI